MTQKLLLKSALPAALTALLADHAVFAPTGEAERHAFTCLSSAEASETADAVNLDGLTTISPKEILFPRSETLYGIGLENGEISTPEPTGPTVIFGVRPCDVRSIANLDCSFLEKGFVDTAYVQRRENLTIIALACKELQSPACFCDSMGGGPASAEGADIMLTETADGKAFLVSFLTAKGEAIEKLWETASVLTEPNSADTAPPPPVCTLKVDKPQDLPAKLMAAFDDPAWERLSESCLGCGTCSYICPTCYCFDIDTEISGGKAEQLRCWDCCMFSDYSRMAGGHDPRPTKKERLRNRFLHKLAYFDERHGRTLCVGCGRCIAKCPSGVDIAHVIEWGGTL
ncbi:MAG: 4Fe-4S dicluster domain-containing protein [Clostridiales bacterium]|nr:4Fe-4S dicluster domain-containing protein [Clostridiales bacterium]